MQTPWKPIEDDVWVLDDSCRVYAVQGPDGIVIVNAGTGQAAEHLSAATGSVDVLLTHHFRDHADGAIRLHAAGAEVWANAWDSEYYLDPEQHFRERLTWNSYDNRWDRFAPIRPLPVTRWLRDYETVTLGGLFWEVMPTPGATNGASSYIVTLTNGRRLAFVGETICGPDGKLARLSPLQYDYNNLPGAANVWHSCNRLLDAKPDCLLPSLGEPMDNPPEAVAALKANLRRLDEISPGVGETFYNLNDPNAEDISEVLPRLWRSQYAVAHTYFVLGKSGRVLSLDYGYNNAAQKMPDVHHVSNRRPLLHGLDGLKKRFGIERIDTALVTHYHDDHVCGIPLLQRLFGTEVWAGDNFADILESPERFDRPCLWHEPIAVTRTLPCGVTHVWDDITFTLFPMSGHTRFSTLILLEIDGVRVAHTGDQIFFQPWEFEPGARLFTNHVYKNGVDLGGYRETLTHLERFRPDWILTGHTNPYQPTDEWYEAIAKGAEAFDDVHQALMPLADDDVHFGPDSQPAELRPYRVHQTGDGPIVFDGWIRNPFGKTQSATVQIVAPDGWRSQSQTLTLAPRAVADFSLTLTPPPGTRCRRLPVALDLTVGDRPFGQVAEALVSIGVPRF